MRRLVEWFGGPVEALSALASDIKRVEGFGEELAQVVAGWEDRVDLSRELRRIEEEELTILTQEDASYPKLLKQIYDPPLVLYVKGTLLPRDQHGIGIVGSRHATQYGLSTAKKLASSLRMPATV